MADINTGKKSRLLATFSRFNFSVEHNALHLGISKSSSLLLLRENIDPYAIIALVPESKAGKHGTDRELFVCLQILSDDMVRKSVSLCQVSEVPNTVTLYSTEFFHKHYRLSDAEDVYIRCVKVFPLTKVIFGAKTAQCYEWAKNHVFSTGLLVSACQQKVLVRNGDQFLAPVIPVFHSDDAYNMSNYHDLVALECEPVMQGVITVNTSIVITQMDGSDDDVQNRVGNTAEDRHNDERNNHAGVVILPEPRLVSEFALQLNDVENLSSLNNISHSPAESPIHRINELLLRPVLVPKSLTHELSMLNSMCTADEQCEASYRVGVTKATLMRLNAFNGSWVCVTVPDHANDVHTALHQASSYPESTASGSTKSVNTVRMASDLEESKDNIKNMSQVNDDAPQSVERRTHLAQVYVMNQNAHTSEISDDGEGTAHIPYDQDTGKDVLYPEDNALYLSPQLWFNLQVHPSRLMQSDALLSIRV